MLRGVLGQVNTEADRRAARGASRNAAAGFVWSAVLLALTGLIASGCDDTEPVTEPPAPPDTTTLIVTLSTGDTLEAEAPDGSRILDLDLWEPSFPNASIGGIVLPTDGDYVLRILGADSTLGWGPYLFVLTVR